MKPYSSIGRSIQTAHNTVLWKLREQNGINFSNDCHQRVWGESTEHCWGTAPLAIPIQQPFHLGLTGVMALLNWTGYSTNATFYPNWNQKSELFPIGATEKHQPSPEQFVTRIYKRFVQWFGPPVVQSKSLLTGLIGSAMKVWHGGLWTMDRFPVCLQAQSWLHYIPKDTQNKRTKFFNNGWNQLGIQPISGESGSQLELTTALGLRQIVVKNGLNFSVDTQFHQWATNLTCVESVTVPGQVEPVYDIEVEDNHNFIANGLLVHNCHQLTAQSQNTLLKCIEEPPAHVVFILCTTEPHKVLPTITSRCQVFNFRALSISAIVEQLRFVAQKESIAIADEALVAIARTADGGLRDALQLLDQLSLLGVEITKSHVIELSGSVAESDLVAILEAIKIGNIFGLLQLSRSLLDNGKTPKLILSNLLTIYRDLLVVMASPKSQDLITGAISYSQLKQLATPWDYEAISAGLTQLQKSENQLRNAAQPHLWLEVCLLGLVTTQSDNSNNSNNGNRSKTALNSKRKSQPKVPTNNLTAIWNKVLEEATPKNRSLLTHAELVELKSDFAVITVEAKYFHKFNCNAEKVEKMFQKATGARVTVSIKERRVK